MTWRNDPEFEVETITKVEEYDDSYLLSFGGSCLGMDKSSVVPRVGQTARLYGRPVRGLVIDGQVVYYRTPAQEEEHHRQQVRAIEENLQREFEQNRARLNAAYNDLHPAFKARIDKFRKTNRDFRWRFESYEMSCCVDAQNIAAALKTPEAIAKWKELPWEKRVKTVSVWDGHSGNSFGCAVALASAFLIDPQRVILMHGALTTLVGCSDYGCPHPYEIPEADY